MIHCPLQRGKPAFSYDVQERTLSTSALFFFCRFDGISNFQPQKQRDFIFHVVGRRKNKYRQNEFYWAFRRFFMKTTEFYFSCRRPMKKISTDATE
jgi:hypothetical protein